MKCFVICPIGEAGSDVRQRSDNVFEFIISEALIPLGYDVERADLIAESGLITTQIIERIVSSDLVVADLTGHNANVFYELALRHVAGKPFIHMISEGEKIPFDVAGSRTILYSLELSGAKKAKGELQAQTKAILESDGKIESPISVALDLRALVNSEDPVETALGRLEKDVIHLRQLTERALSIYEQRASDLDAADLERLSEVTRPGSSWTEERVDLLRKMWGDGYSASVISRALGKVTRNAVLGKVHRLGLDQPKDDYELLV